MMTGTPFITLLTAAVVVQPYGATLPHAAMTSFDASETTQSASQPPVASQTIPGTPPPPPPVKPDEDLAKEEIVEVLEQYRKAHEARDFSSLQRVYPTAPAQWRNQMAQYVRLEISSEAPRFERIDLSNATAVVEVVWTRTGVHKYTRKEHRRQTHTIHLDRKTFDNRWVIARVSIR